MPKVTVYIRNEDIEKWRSIGAKTTFVHNALNGLPEPIKTKRLEHLTDQLARAETKVVDTIVEEEPFEVVKCKGTHYMDRTSCGRPGCPWGGVK